MMPDASSLHVSFSASPTADGLCGEQTTISKKLVRVAPHASGLHPWQLQGGRHSDLDMCNDVDNDDGENDDDFDDMINESLR